MDRNTTSDRHRISSGTAFGRQRVGRRCLFLAAASPFFLTTVDALVSSHGTAIKTPGWTVAVRPPSASRRRRSLRHLQGRPHSRIPEVVARSKKFDGDDDDVIDVSVSPVDAGDAPVPGSSVPPTSSSILPLGLFTLPSHLLEDVRSYLSSYDPPNAKMSLTYTAVPFAQNDEFGKSKMSAIMMEEEEKRQGKNLVKADSLFTKALNCDVEPDVTVMITVHNSAEVPADWLDAKADGSGGTDDRRDKITVNVRRVTTSLSQSLTGRMNAVTPASVAMDTMREGSERSLLEHLEGGLVDLVKAYASKATKEKQEEMMQSTEDDDDEQKGYDEYENDEDDGATVSTDWPSRTSSYRSESEPEPEPEPESEPRDSSQIVNLDEMAQDFKKRLYDKLVSEGNDDEISLESFGVEETSRSLSSSSPPDEGNGNDSKEGGGDQFLSEMYRASVGSTKEKKNDIETKTKSARKKSSSTSAFDDDKKTLTSQDLAAQVLEHLNSSTKPDRRPGFYEGAEAVLMEEEGEGSADVKKELRDLFRAGKNFAEGRSARINIDPLDTTAPGDLASTAQGDLENPSQSNDDAVFKHNDRKLGPGLAEMEVPISGISSRDREVFDLLSGPPRDAPAGDFYDGPEGTAAPRDSTIAGANIEDILDPSLRQEVEDARWAVLTLGRIVREDSTKNHDEGEHYIFHPPDGGESKEVPIDKVAALQQCVAVAIRSGLVEDPQSRIMEDIKFDVMLDEMRRTPPERYPDVMSSYKDVLLSDRYSAIMKDRLSKAGSVRSEEEKEMFNRLNTYAMVLLREVRAVGAEMEATQLETIREICKVAMDPQYEDDPQKGAWALSDRVASMRPALDDTFIAYLKYAIEEEEARLVREDKMLDPGENRWLMVLRIVQGGVYAELRKRVDRYVEDIWYVLRMEEPCERRSLLGKFVNDLATLDVRPFRKAVDNVVAALGGAADVEKLRGLSAETIDEAKTLGSFSKQILQLGSDIEEVLSAERMDVMAKDADEWNKKRKEKAMAAAKQRAIEAGKDNDGDNSTRISLGGANDSDYVDKMP